MSTFDPASRQAEKPRTDGKMLTPSPVSVFEDAHPLDNGQIERLRSDPRFTTFIDNCIALSASEFAALGQELAAALPDDPELLLDVAAYSAAQQLRLDICASQGAKLVRRRERDCFTGGARVDSTLELAKTLYKTPALVSHRVRCGNPTCRCATGEGHGPYWFLHWREGKVQRRRYVRIADVAAVSAVVADRRHAANETRVLLRLGREWLHDLDDLLRGVAENDRL